MNRTEILKFRYKRHNETENKVLIGLIDKYPDIIIFDQYNTKTIVNERIKKYKGTVLLFLDVFTPNLTAKGNHRRIEFLFVNKQSQCIWIDAKHANTTTNITDLHGEYNRASNCNGSVQFVVDGKGYSKNVLKEHRKYLKKAKLDNVSVIELAEFIK